MRAGNLDRRISIEKYGLGGDDGWGNPSPTFTPLGNFRAQIVQGNNEEFFQAGGIVEVEAVVFRTRYIDGLSTADRVVYLGRIFNILETREIGRRNGLDIRCTSTGEMA